MRIAQDAALAADSLRDQEGRRPGQGKRRRVKLIELEIGDGRAGPVGGGESVPGGDLRVRGVTEELAGAARRKHDDSTSKVSDVPLWVEHSHAGDTLVLDKQVNQEMPLADVYTRFSKRAAERDLDPRAGCVAPGVKDT